MNKTVINPSEIGKQFAAPQIKVIEGGKEIVRPDVIQAVVQLATLGQLTRIRKSIEREEFEGKIDSRTLIVTDEVKTIELVNDWPYTPWATATFFNDGDPTLPPGTNIPVYIGLNNLNPFATLMTGEALPADFTKADMRMEIVYYWCDAGNTALVRVVGKY